MRRAAARGFTLLEVMVSLLLLSAVALAGGSVIRSLGVLGVVQYSSQRDDHPARLRTLAMEYAQAELEYLKNYAYDRFRDGAACNPSAGLPVPFATARRVPDTYLAADEPPLPALFAKADILIANEPVVSPAAAPYDCRPRRITVRVYLKASDAPAAPGGNGGVVFFESVAVRALR